MCLLVIECFQKFWAALQFLVATLDNRAGMFCLSVVLWFPGSGAAEEVHCEAHTPFPTTRSSPSHQFVLPRTACNRFQLSPPSDRSFSSPRCFSNSSTIPPSPSTVVYTLPSIPTFNPPRCRPDTPITPLALPTCLTSATRSLLRGTGDSLLCWSLKEAGWSGSADGMHLGVLLSPSWSLARAAWERPPSSTLCSALPSRIMLSIVFATRSRWTRL